MAQNDIDFFFGAPASVAERRRRAALRDGLAHGNRITPSDPLPDEPVTLSLFANAAMPIDRVAVYYTTDATEPGGLRGVSTTSDVVLALPGDVRPDAGAGLNVRVWQATIPGQPDRSLVRYRADGWSLHDAARHWWADSVDPVGRPPEGGQIFAYSVDRYQPPSWLDDAVIYQVFVDRFATAAGEPPMRDPGTIKGIFGGTLRGVLEKLDYLQALGITCIWLTPVFESPSAHRYDPADHYHVADRVGGDVALVELIQAAHARDMRVLLDFVANHTSNRHPRFVEALADPTSEAARWYAIGPEWPRGYAAYANVPTMPELMTERPEVQRHLVGVALDWLSYFRADGLRLDYVPGPSLGFWATFQHWVKQRYPNALTLGEITEPLSDIAAYAGRVDAFMDFPLTHLLRDVFALRSASLDDLLTYLDARAPDLPPHMGRATLLDNHDMQRFLWLAKHDTARLQLAAACQLTLDGTPIIYYGTEVGLSQADDARKENAHARAPMIWDERQDHALLEYFRRLIALRLAHPALRHGARVRVPVRLEDAPGADDVSAHVGAYVRMLDDDAVIVVLNNAERPVTVRVALGDHLRASALRDALASAGDSDHPVVDGDLRLSVPALSAALLVPSA